MSNDELPVDPVTGLVALCMFDDQVAVQEAIDADLEERGLLIELEVAIERERRRRSN